MNKKIKCIYCNSEGPFSEEHSLPMSLGEFKGFPYILNKVCKDCNTKIGKSEEQFGRSGPEAFFRKYLGVRGRVTHDVVNPFLRGSMGANPIEFKSKLPGEEIEILWEFNPEGKTVREVRQIVFIDEEGKSYPLRISDWMKSTDQIRAKMEELGLKGKNLSARVFAPDEEMFSVESLVSSLGKTFEWLPPQPTDQIQGAQITLSVTDHYFRAIAKIGFHYLLSASDYFEGNESYFESIRKFIMEGGNTEDFVTQNFEPIISFPSNYRPLYWGHVLVAEQIHGYIQARLQFFLGPQYDPPTHIVRLAHMPILLCNPMSYGHYFRYYESEPIEKYYGEVEPLDSLKIKIGLL
jgi:hypothetical protein